MCLGSDSFTAVFGASQVFQVSKPAMLLLSGFPSVLPSISACVLETIVF